jgi:hypothetical protein
MRRTHGLGSQLAPRPVAELRFPGGALLPAKLSLVNATKERSLPSCPAAQLPADLLA